MSTPLRDTVPLLRRFWLLFLGLLSSLFITLIIWLIVGVVPSAILTLKALFGVGFPTIILQISDYLLQKEFWILSGVFGGAMLLSIDRAFFDGRVKRMLTRR